MSNSLSRSTHADLIINTLIMELHTLKYQLSQMRRDRPGGFDSENVCSKVSELMSQIPKLIAMFYTVTVTDHTYINGTGSCNFHVPIQSMDVSEPFDISLMPRSQYQENYPQC